MSDRSSQGDPFDVDTMVGPKKDIETLILNQQRVETSGRLTLVVVSAGGVVNHPLPDSGAVSIGRSEQCDVSVQDPSLSRKHALLHLGPPLTLEDLGSANGTRVRGQSLAPNRPVQITPEEALELGSSLLVVQHRASPVRLRRLWNHDYFEGRVFEECARVERSGGSFAVVRIHCDANVPGELIQEALGDVLRAVDVFGLYAPGEYEVLLVDTGPDDADFPLSRIGTEMARRGVTVQTGVAFYARDGRDADSLVAKASQLARGGVVEGASGRVVLTEGGAMQNLHRLVERVAVGTISVLILGETGVGKEVLAEAVHKASPRADKPFLRLNCAALSESLLESELFGHERGAFTGAVRAKSGLLETAQGGTVFIDEVGELPMSIQVKLLRVLEERAVMRVGAVKPIKIDVRFVAATNRDLEAEVQRNAFRQDLYFRLNGITLVIPPLRERVSEIEGLAKAFIVQASESAGRRDRPVLAPEALALLQHYSWPGNIRELRNLIERAVLLCTDGIIRLEHLPVQRMRATFAARSMPADRSMVTPGALAGGRTITRNPPPPSSSPPPLPLPGVATGAPPPPSLPPLATAESIKREMGDIERRRIVEVLERCAGNQTQAAKLLGISRRTLVNRLEAYNLPRPRKNIGE